MILQLVSGPLADVIIPTESSSTPTPSASSGSASVNGPTLDVAAPNVTLAIPALLGLFVAVVLVEAGVLWLLKWDKPGRCTLDAGLANLFSTLLGLFLLLTFKISFGGIVGYSIAWLLSVVSEGIVLAALGHRRISQVVVAALATNLVSYLLLFLVVGRS